MAKIRVLNEIHTCAEGPLTLRVWDREDSKGYLKELLLGYFDRTTSNPQNHLVDGLFYKPRKRLRPKNKPYFKDSNEEAKWNTDVE